MGFTIDVKKSNLIIRLYGELDHHLTEKVRLSIDNKYSEINLKNIILDLTQLTLMDSSGIGLIMGRYKKTSEKKGELLIISSNVYIDRMLKMSGLLKIVKVYNTLEEALENLER